MIRRENYLTVRNYLEYRKLIMQRSEETLRMEWIAMKHLLLWADETLFQKADSLLPVFPEYMACARRDSGRRDRQQAGQVVPLSPRYQVKILEHARLFYEWARVHDPEYKRVREAWISTLQVRRSKGAQSRLQKREVWKSENVHKVADFYWGADNLKAKRTAFAVVFLFLSGMRAGAFVTLPFECVDLKRRRIEQLPEKGVHTKNSKAAITFLLPIPTLLKVVEDWMSSLAEHNNPRMRVWSKLYSSIEANRRVYNLSGFDVVRLEEKTGPRVSLLNQDMKELCDLVGVPFFSPHKLRHGHGLYGVHHSHNMEELKAVSQNLMHSNIGITDGIYGRLPEDEVSSILSGLTEERK